MSMRALELDGLKRIEVIDFTHDFPGRQYIRDERGVHEHYMASITLQDDGRTLKISIQED